MKLILKQIKCYQIKMKVMKTLVKKVMMIVLAVAVTVAVVIAKIIPIKLGDYGVGVIKVVVKKVCILNKFLK